MKIGTIITIIGLILFASLFLWIYYENHSIHQVEFQINCNPDNTECRVSSENTEGRNYGLFAVNHSPQGDAINYTLSNGECVIKSTSDLTNYNLPDGRKITYVNLGDMEVKYSYQVLCNSLGKLSIWELVK